MPKVLLTRPRAASQALADELERQGYACVVEPLLVIEPVKAKRPAVDPAAVMITSANALIAGQGLEAFFDIPCFCVGPRSAAQARELGFREVRNATADGVELAWLIAGTLGKTMAAGKPSILHICGQNVGSAARDELSRLGYHIAGWPVYKARPVAHLTAPTVELLREGKIDAVMVFSPRTAQTLGALLRAQALEACCARLTAIGLSHAVADALRPLSWQELIAAPAPTEEAVIACLRQACPATGEPDDRRRKTVS